MQNIVWLGQQMYPDLPIYNAAYSFRFNGTLDIQAFSRAHKRLVDTTDSFKIVFQNNESTPKQYVLEAAPGNLQIRKLSALDQLALDELLLAESKKKLDLDTCPWNSILFEQEDGSHTWLLVHHHLLTDGISFQIILQRLANLYATETLSNNKPVEQTTPSFATWISNLKTHQGPKVDEKQSTPYSKLYSSKAPSGAPFGERRNRKIEPRLNAAIEQLAQSPTFASFSKELSLNLILLSSLFALLARIERKTSLCIGIANHGRMSKLEKEIAGLLVSVVPLTIEIDDSDTFSHLYEKVRDSYFEQMRSSVDASSRKTNTQDFDVTYSFLDGGLSDFAGIPVTANWLYPGCHESANRWRIHFTYSNANALEMINDFNDEAFSLKGQETATENLTETIAAFANNPDTKIFEYTLAPTNKSNVSPKTPKTASASNLAKRFNSIVKRYPNSIAARSNEGQLTYSELAESVAALAPTLATKSHNNDQLVPIIGQRSIKMLQSSLAAMQAGKAFLPLDSNLPKQRIESILADSQASSSIDTSEALPRSSAILTCDRSESDIAYVIYTSGSTGTPNGVAIEHSSVLNLLEDMETKAALDSNCNCMWWTAVSFDVSIYEIFSAVLFGHTLCIPPEEIRMDPVRLFNWMQQYEIHSAYLPPFMLTAFDNWLDANRNLPLKRLLVGVEPIQEELLVSIANKLDNLNIINGYGPTETTVCATLYPIEKNSKNIRRTPIGSPVSGNQCYILDNHLNLMPQGATGELYIAGAGVAKGYWNRPELDRSRFLENPFSTNKDEQRMYKTGDLVRLSDDGNLEFVAREDGQIKLRGHRIEPAEIEKAMARYPTIEQCAVRLARIGEQDELVCHYVSSEKIENEALFSHAVRNLPFQLLPKRFYHLDHFPTTPNGKIDFEKLTVPIDTSTTEAGTAALEPDGPIETQIAAIWAEELDLPTIDAKENFFELGGSSMAAMKISQALCQEFDVDLPLQIIFQFPTVTQLAHVIEDKILDSIEDMSEEEAAKLLSEDEF